MSIRKSAVGGSFYPNSQTEIERYIHHFSQNLSDISLDIKVKAIVVPHAGYVYSGFTANVAYYLSQNMNVKRLIVIGPSHRVYLKDSSICLADSYETPLGEIAIDKEYAKDLQNNFSFLTSIPDAHHEHSTETQAPFIKHYFKDAKIVEIVYGKQDASQLSSLVDYCMKGKENLVVISTDLSHFYTLQQANYLDNICLQAIKNKNVQQLDEGCEACGMIGIKAVLLSAIQRDLKVELLNYTTSFEQSKDDTSVVGYCSFILGE